MTPKHLWVDSRTCGKSLSLVMARGERHSVFLKWERLA